MRDHVNHASAKDFLVIRYSLESQRQTASVYAGVVYTMSMIISPFLGRAVDYFGHRVILALLAFLSLTAALGMMIALPSFGALLPMVLVGLACK